MMRLTFLHSEDCNERWMWEGTATGVLGHFECKCVCHYRERFRKWMLEYLTRNGSNSRGRKIIKRLLREFQGNNWVKVVADKIIRYTLTILVLDWVTGDWQIVNLPLLSVAFIMPVIDIIVFDLIDKYRKPNNAQ